MPRINLDKYYTHYDLAEYCINKTYETIGRENIDRIIEPSAGNGSFSKQISNCIAIDIEPEDESISAQDFLQYKIEYILKTLVIGNPPYGRCLNMAQKFFKKSVQIADYISFILPISQLNNSQSMYEFNLIYSEDLGKRMYTDRQLHCCLNIYRRPNNGLNSKPKNKLKDISIYRQDGCDYNEQEFDLRMCYWGDGTAGKILADGENYSAEYKIKIHNEGLKDDIINYLKQFNWKEYLNCIAMRKIQQFHIIAILSNKFPQLI